MGAASTGASPYQSIYTAADQRYFPASEYLACSYRSLSTYYPEYAQYSYLQEMTSSTRPPLYESQLLQSSANSHQQDECKYGYDSGQQAKESESRDESNNKGKDGAVTAEEADGAAIEATTLEEDGAKEESVSDHHGHRSNSGIYCTPSLPPVSHPPPAVSRLQPDPVEKIHLLSVERGTHTRLLLELH